MQYRVIGVHPTGLTVARGVGRCPQGNPPSSGLSREEKRSEVQPLWRCTFAFDTPLYFFFEYSSHQFCEPIEMMAP